MADPGAGPSGPPKTKADFVRILEAAGIARDTKKMTLADVRKACAEKSLIPPIEPSERDRLATLLDAVGIKYHACR